MADSNFPQRSIYDKGMKPYSYTPEAQVYVLLIRLRADKANLIKHAFGIGRAKRGPMWRLMREEGKILKEENIVSYKSKRRILKETVGRAEGIAWVTRLSRKIALQERSSETQFKSSRKNRTGT